MEVHCGFTSDCLGGDGNMLVCIGGDGDPNSVSVYSASAGELLRSLSGRMRRVRGRRDCKQRQGQDDLAVVAKEWRVHGGVCLR